MNKIKKISSILLIASVTLPLAAIADSYPRNLNTPIHSINDIYNILERLVNVLFAIVMIAAAWFILLAAYNYLSSGGDEDKIKSAHTQLMYAIVAISVGFLAKGIIYVVKNFLGA